MTPKSVVVCFVLVHVIVLVLSPTFVASAPDRNSTVDAAASKRGSPCVDRPLEERERAADAIFSGTIRDVKPDKASSSWSSPAVTWRARVALKRVLKGARVVDDLAESIDEDGRTNLWIGGFGNRTLCQSHARKHDSWIFIVRRVDGQLVLSSSLVRINLYNIEHADAVVQHKPFTTTPATYHRDPCDAFFCPFWGQCFVDAATREPGCRCREKCSSTFAPVCATDNVTYSNDCLMQISSCTQQKRINVAYPGSCDVRDPCDGKSCSFGARCVPSLDGLVARCQCPESCASHGDSVDSGPVCGSDGVDYRNLCEMQRAACRLMKDIRRKYDGVCDPCRGVNCGQQVCQLDPERRRVCQCGAHRCSSNSSPVCGTDGVTYFNECYMRSEACRTKYDIRVMRGGACNDGFNPCKRIMCGPYQKCVLSSDKLYAKCECPSTPCDPYVRLVCASDGRTYDNECEMEKNGCRRQMLLTVRQNGPCVLGGPCETIQCTFNSVCIVQNGRPTCACPTCTEEFQPVCGTNNVTYDNECRLKAENCEKRDSVQVKYKGLCSKCESKKCEFYSICEDDGRGGAHCVCPSSCVEVDQKVCGSDGVTYANECEMRLASCRKKQYVIIQSEGSCDSCIDVTCRHGARCENGRCVCSLQCPKSSGEAEMVCATDGQTYSSECAVRMAACQQSKDIEVESPGPCDEMLSGSGELCDELTCRFGGICKYDTTGLQGCTCNFSCDAVRSSVCGSDGKVYSNECLLKEESCKRQVEITIQSSENCGELSEELCDGKNPLVNPKTGLEYDCDEGRDSCPSGSYCHKTTADFTVARCCPEELPISSCDKTEFGCCSDGHTIAPGPNRTGCPNFCQCNILGSLSTTCDPVTRQCTCKPGVGGVRCDRCDPGYWGLPKIAEGNSGCTPCGCNPLGSVRDDCEQMTGRCMCRPGLTGQKCTLCTNGRELVASGTCEDEMLSDQPVAPRSCRDLNCQYGTKCVKLGSDVPRCVCDVEECNDVNDESAVCGTDGQTYGSPCQLRRIACRMQKDIDVEFQGSCKNGKPSNIIHRSPSPTTKKIPATTKFEEIDEGLIGSLCESDDDCLVDFSICNGICVCNKGYTASTDGWSCTVETTTTPPFTTSIRQTLPSLSSSTMRPKTVPPTQITTISPKPTVPKRTPRIKTSTSVPSTVQTSTTIPTTTTPPSTTTTTTKTTVITTSSPSLPPLTTLAISTRLPTVASDIGTLITVPEFHGNSHLELPLKKPVGRSLDYEIWLLANEPNGVILYARQIGSTKGDFLSLNLVDGYLQLRYDLGTGFANITSKTKLLLKTWNRVTISRRDKDGSLRINDDQLVTGTSKGAARELNLQMKLFVGGFPEQYHPNAGITSGFRGAIQRINESGILIENLAKNAEKLEGITDYHGPPCWTSSGENVCSNGGLCVPRLDSYVCNCIPPFSGETCATDSSTDNIPMQPEAVDPDAPVQFDGVTHHYYYNGVNVKQGSQRNNKYEVRFKTTADSGIILIQNKGTSIQTDYLVMAIIDGRIEVSFNLGKQSPKNLFMIRSTILVTDDEWHTVIFNRQDTKVSLAVDSERPVTSSSTPGASDLNTDGLLWLGGKAKNDIPTGLPLSYYSSFDGCIATVTVDDKPLHLVDNRINDLPQVKHCSSSSTV